MTRTNRRQRRPHIAHYVNLSGRHVLRTRIKEWHTLYERSNGEKITIRGFKRPTKHRTIRNKKYKAVKVNYKVKDLIYMAKTKKKKGGKEKLSEEELEELEELEDLDDLEDEDADDEDEESTDDDEDEDEDEDEDDDDEEEDDEDEDDEDDEDEDEEDDEVEDDDEEEEEEKPKKKKSSKSSTKKKKGKSKSRAKANDKIGVQEVAEAAGTDGRTLRMVLRKHGIEKDDDSGRYEWSSLSHPEVKKIIKLVKERGEGRKVKQESLDNLKKKTKKTKSSGTTTKKKKGKKKKAAPVEDDDE